MSQVSNPRFPHQCRIIRKTVDDPLTDEDDFTPLPTDAPSDEYDPLGNDKEVSNESVAEETAVAEEDTTEGSQTTVIYEGSCRSYERHTTSDTGEIITSYRGLSLPLTQDDWIRLGVVPQEGDEVALDRGSHREYGRVIDVNPSNFHGTHITWRYGRN